MAEVLVATSRMKYELGMIWEASYRSTAFHIMQRMQDAGWSADVERWESHSDDSGSDHDGDESDLRMLMI